MNVPVQSANPPGRPTAKESERRQDLIRAAWAVILTVVLAAALWFGVASGRAGSATTVQPTVVPTAVATTVQPIAVPTAVATAIASGATADQATPTDQQRATAELQLQSTEQEYCPCNGAVQVSSP